MKKLVIIFVAIISLCSCNSNFEDYNYYGYFFPEFYFPELEQMKNVEIRMRCSFLNPEEGSEGMLAIKQVDETGEIMSETGNTALYIKTDDGIELLSPMKVTFKTQKDDIISITITDINVEKDYLFVRARKIGDKKDKRYYDVDNMIWIDFDKAEMNEWASFKKQYGK
ncbi:MAG: hypothetical protein IJD91_06250 [Clostridia bacterium]|nr:hypothetical protein [Clostridia bacterium]